jgi:hypothetical protein
MLAMVTYCLEYVLIDPLILQGFQICPEERRFTSTWTAAEQDDFFVVPLHE